MNDFFTPRPVVLAHRGNSLNYPENTEPAFQAALDIPVDVIETDVHLMRDGGVLISHDDNLERCSGVDNPISILSKDELDEIDMGWSFTPDGGNTFPFRGKGITPLLLEEALRLFPVTRFNIDLKDKSRELAEKAAEVLKSAGAEKRVCVGSFNHSTLKAFRKALPGCATSLSQREIILIILFYRFGWKPSSVRKGIARAAQIPEKAGPYRIIRPSFIRWCRKNSLALQVWTVNDKEKMKELLSEGVDGLFSDNPVLLAEVCREFN